MSEVALLPCPFCGSADVDPKFAYFQRPAEEGGGTYGHESGCMKCGASAPAEIWNRRQSLSQEAVRDEALEEAARVCDAEALRATLCAGQLRGAEMAAATSTELAKAIRALKREPNAAASGSCCAQPLPCGAENCTHPKLTTAPAAPDVAEVLSDWRVVAEFFASRNWPDTKLGDAASRLHARLPALLAKLGQEWIPVSGYAEARARFGGEGVKADKHSNAFIYFVDSKTQWFAMPLPPAPGASDE